VEGSQEQILQIISTTGSLKTLGRAYSERQKRLRVESGAGLPNPIARVRIRMQLNLCV